MLAEIENKNDEKIINEIEKDYIFLQDWLNECSSYILGVILADGYLNPISDPAGKRLTLDLAIKDVDYLIKLAIWLGIKKIKYRMDKSGNIVSAKFRFYGAKALEPLYKMNLHVSKSTKFDESIFNYVPQKYKSHFLRGIFDGDGCMYLRKNENRGTLSFHMGNREVLERIKKEFHDKLGIIKGSIRCHKDSKNKWTLEYNSRVDIVKILDYMYTDHEKSFWLPRKKEKGDIYKERNSKNEVSIII